MNLTKQQAQRMRDRHEDIEDLLSHGATVAEIIERSGYKGWPGIHASLRAAGRHDLLGKLKVKLADADLPSQWVREPPRVPSCTRPLCVNRLFEDELCLFHAEARFRWCDEPGCERPKSRRNKCGPHYEAKLLNRGVGK